MATSIQVEYFGDRTVQKNRDLIRRIRLMLDDVGLDIQRHAQHRNEIIGKRIIRAIWKPNETETGFRIMDHLRLEQPTAQTYVPISQNPTNIPSNRMTNKHSTEEPHITQDIFLFIRNSNKYNRWKITTQQKHATFRYRNKWTTQPFTPHNKIPKKFNNIPTNLLTKRLHNRARIHAYNHPRLYQTNSQPQEDATGIRMAERIIDWGWNDGTSYDEGIEDQDCGGNSRNIMQNIVKKEEFTDGSTYNSKYSSAEDLWCDMRAANACPDTAEFMQTHVHGRREYVLQISVDGTEMTMVMQPHLERDEIQHECRNLPKTSE